MEENLRPNLGEDNIEYEDDEYLMKCVVDPAKRTFFLYSSEGDTKTVVCETPDQFMNVLELVRATCPEDRLRYTNPL
jgi:hypothetical protein